MNEKTTDAQRRASRKWEEKNRSKATINNYRRTAKMFIKKHATIDDIKEIEEAIKSRKIELGD